MASNIKALLGDSYKEDMTADEIVAALETVTLPQDNTDEITRLKNAVSKANSEAAENKRKLKEKMSEDEKRSAEEAERITAIETENKELKKKIAISEYTAKFLASGLDAESAAKSAEAAYTGDIDTVISNFNNRIASVKESVKAELIGNNPVIAGGNASKAKDYSGDISSSIATGDFASAAALMRLSQETSNE